MPSFCAHASCVCLSGQPTGLPAPSERAAFLRATRCRTPSSSSSMSAPDKLAAGAAGTSSASPTAAGTAEDGGASSAAGKGEALIGTLA
ncbi:hypothetical protein EON67_02425 [archaeon]|nr:MAG: hypothetical protein EON67_02425 [archaeon]